MTNQFKSQKTGDFQLVRLAAQGCQESFARLVHRHHREIRLYLAKRTGSIDTGDELAQEVFLAMIERVSSLSQPEKFRGWLFGIARNKAAEFFRRKKRELTTESSAIERLLLDHSLRECANEDAANTLRQTKALQLCINKLNPESQRLLQARYFDNESVEKIARGNSRTSGGLRMALFRLRKVLARCIRQQLRDSDR